MINDDRVIDGPARDGGQQRFVADEHFARIAAVFRVFDERHITQHSVNDENRSVDQTGRSEPFDRFRSDRVERVTIAVKKILKIRSSLKK